MKAARTLALLSYAAAVWTCGSAAAYIEEYPPHAQEDLRRAARTLKTVLDTDNPRYRAGQVEARLEDGRLYLRDGRSVIVDSRGHTIAEASERPVPVEVYHLDLDGNGHRDFVVHSWYGGTGLASLTYRVDMYLRGTDGRYGRIQYETLSPDARDYTDLDGDGIPEILITGTYSGPEHNYYTYHAYRARGGRLLPAVGVQGLPKYIWMTVKPNDKDTTHLTRQERAAHTRRVDASIRTAPPAAAARKGA